MDVFGARGRSAAARMRCFGTDAVETAAWAERTGRLAPCIASASQVGEFYDGRSVSAEHERLERKHQRLKTQDQGVHERERIHNVKSCTFQEASLF